MWVRIPLRAYEVPSKITFYHTGRGKGSNPLVAPNYMAIWCNGSTLKIILQIFPHFYLRVWCLMVNIFGFHPKVAGSNPVTRFYNYDSKNSNNECITVIFDFTIALLIKRWYYNNIII